MAISGREVEWTAGGGSIWNYSNVHCQGLSSVHSEDSSRSHCVALQFYPLMKCQNPEKSHRHSTAHWKSLMEVPLLAGSTKATPFLLYFDWCRQLHCSWNQFVVRSPTLLIVIPTCWHPKALEIACKLFLIPRSDSSDTLRTMLDITSLVWEKAEGPGDVQPWGGSEGIWCLQIL